MSKFAEKTSVSSDRSRAEIEKTLVKYGARGFAYAWQDNQAMMGFTMSGKQIRFSLPLPSMDDPEISKSPRGRTRTKAQMTNHYEQMVRQRWRALNLVIKAKLEAVESGISVFEEEFLANIVLSDGKTVGQHTIQKIEDSYSNQSFPKLLEF